MPWGVSRCEHKHTSFSYEALSHPNYSTDVRCGLVWTSWAYPSFDKPGHFDKKQLRQPIADYQKRTKQYTDNKRRPRPFTAGVGGYVLVKLPTHQPKQTPSFGTPERIQKALGPSTFFTSEGECWNASRLSRAFVPARHEIQRSDTNPETGAGT